MLVWFSFFNEVYWSCILANKLSFDLKKENVKYTWDKACVD